MASYLPKRTLMILGVLIPVLVIAIDQYSKVWAINFFDQPLDICKTDPYIAFNHDVLPFFDLGLLCNQGISFGQLSGDSAIKRWGLSLFALAVSGVLFWMLFKSKDRLSALSLGLIAGGAIGNAIDRIRFGAVVDFLNFEELYFPFVFNLADTAITCGVIGLILAAFFVKDPDAKTEN